jgi:hypothetical protein
MARRVNKFGKDSQASTFGRLVDPIITENKNLRPEEFLDFIESPTGVNLTLFPMQRLILRCMFGIPFDYKPEVPSFGYVPIYDKFREELLYAFKTEAEALHWLHEEGKCNIGDWKDVPKGGYKESNLIVGRRGGKSSLVAAAGDIKLFQLLNVRSPQEYFGLIPGSFIDFRLHCSRRYRICSSIRKD